MKKHIIKLLSIFLFLLLFSSSCIASSIDYSNSFDGDISYELNDFDTNNEGVEDSFVPYTEEEIKKNQVETNFIKLKVLFLKHKYFSFFLLLIIVVFLIAGIIRKREKDNL